jgi:hypothetical protein
MEYNFEKIKLLLNIKYYKNLINVCNKNNINSSFLENKKNILISQNNNDNVLSCENNITETDIVSENIDYLYTKSWNKLNQIHKVIKIKEFINNLDINEHAKEELRELLIEMLKDKKKKNKINYDEVKCKIINITSLVFVDGKYKIEE